MQGENLKQVIVFNALLCSWRMYVGQTRQS